MSKPLEGAEIEYGVRVQMNDASNREGWIEANSAPSVVYLNGTTGLVDFVAMEISPDADGHDLGGEA